MRVLKFLFLVCCFIKGNEGIRENNVADVIFRFYNGNTLTQFIDINLPNAAALLNEADFNIASPTLIYVHGYNENADIESVQVVISAHLDMFPNSNIILIDWSNMASGDYLGNAAPNTKLVAAAAAAEIKTLVNGGLNLQGIHLVGHSLGGHVVGFMGRILTGYNMKLNRHIKHNIF